MKKYDIIIGIDPGASSGAIGVYRYDHFGLERMPNGFLEIMDALNLYRGKNVVVFIEKVGHFRGEDPVKKFAIAKLEKNFNECVNVCQALGFDYCLVPAVTWQRFLRIPNIKGEEYEDRKTRFWKIAQSKTNLAKIYKYAADACLITLFGKHVLEVDRQLFEKLKQ